MTITDRLLEAVVKRCKKCKGNSFEAMVLWEKWGLKKWVVRCCDCTYQDGARAKMLADAYRAGARP